MKTSLKNNLVIAGLGVFLLLTASLVKCGRTSITEQQVELQRQKVDSLQCVLDSLMLIPTDTLVVNTVEYKTRTITNVNTIVDSVPYPVEYPQETYTTQFTKDNVALDVKVTVQNSEVVDFQYGVTNLLPTLEEQTYVDTIYAIVHEVVYDTTFVVTDVTESDLRNFNISGGLLVGETIGVAAPYLKVYSRRTSFGAGWDFQNKKPYFMVEYQFLNTLKKK